MSKAPPTVSGRAVVGGSLSCASGRWSVTPSKVTYRWVAEGRPIPGAASRLIRVRKVEEGLKLACVVTPYSGSVAGTPSTSRAVYVSAPVVSGCPTASASLQSLLRLLGLTRAQIGEALKGSSSGRRRYEDVFCLTRPGCWSATRRRGCWTRCPRACGAGSAAGCYGSRLRTGSTRSARSGRGHRCRLRARWSG